MSSKGEKNKVYFVLFYTSCACVSQEEEAYRYRINLRIQKTQMK
jgi:hypothetical protein